MSGTLYVNLSYLLYLLHDTFFPHLITFLGFDNLFPISRLNKLFTRQFQGRSQRRGHYYSDRGSGRVRGCTPTAGSSLSNLVVRTIFLNIGLRDHREKETFQIDWNINRIFTVIRNTVDINLVYRVIKMFSLNNFLLYFDKLNNILIIYYYC